MNIEEQYLKEAESFFASKQFTSAGIYARKVLRRNPLQLEALILLAKLHVKNNNINEAFDKFSFVILNYPDSVEAYLGLLSIAESRYSYFDANRYLKILSRLAPSNLDYKFRLGLTSSQIGNVKDAEEALNFCVAQHYHNPAAILNLGHVHKAKGDTSIAAELYHKYINVVSDFKSTGYWSLADLKDYKFTETDHLNLTKYLLNRELSPANKALALFSLSRLYEQNNDYEKAFNNMSEANKLLSLLRPFKEKQFISTIQSLLDISSPDSVEIDSDDFIGTPIFIVGMPRSGTTLVEQILASHSLVGATDELPYIERIALSLEMEGGYARGISTLSSRNASKMKQSYLNSVSQYFESVPKYFIDKNPNNFLHIGLIKSLFPKAKIINVIRHAPDNALSVFKQHFSRGHDYSYSLKSINTYWNNYFELMKHWDLLFASELYHVSFEKLVSEPQTEIGKLLDYCGLKHEPECFAFYESKRVVLTPSASQVRKPMNVKALWQGKKYECYMPQEFLQFENIADRVNQQFLD